MTSDSPASLQFNGASNSVKIFADGTMVIHTIAAGDDSTSLIVSIQQGTHQLRTFATLHVKALHGSCWIKVNEEKEKELKPSNVARTIPIGATFTLRAKGAVLRVAPDQGPGFGGPRVPDETVP